MLQAEFQYQAKRCSNDDDDDNNDDGKANEDDNIIDGIVCIIYDIDDFADGRSTSRTPPQPLTIVQHLPPPPVNCKLCCGKRNAIAEFSQERFCS